MQRIKKKHCHLFCFKCLAKLWRRGLRCNLLLLLGIKTELTEGEPLKYRTTIFRCTDLGSHNRLHLSFYLSKLRQPCNLESLLPSVKCELMRPDWSSHQLRVCAFRGLRDGAEGRGPLCPHVKGFQIKGRDWKVIFGGVLGCVSITLSGIILEEFTHVHLTPGENLVLQGRRCSVVKLH